MTKFIYFLFLMVLLTVGCALSGAWSTYDLGLQCTKCLAEKSVVEQRLLGFTVSRQMRNGDAGMDYGRIFGHHCEHIFRKSGFGRGSHSVFGRMVACGKTNEGSFFQVRNKAVFAAFRAEQQYHDQKLTRETFQLIDGLMPPDVQFDVSQQESPAQVNLMLLEVYLKDVRSVDQWRSVLDSAHQGFSDTSHLPVKR